MPSQLHIHIDSHLLILRAVLHIKVQTKCIFFIAEFERAGKSGRSLLPFLNISSSSRVITV